jgi:single-strand DNA-binding protein
MLNQLILTGNLGNDPEIFFGSEGDAVTSFSLAFKSGKDKTGWDLGDILYFLSQAKSLKF